MEVGNYAKSSDEDIPLLSKRSWFALRYSGTHICVSSKSALLILVWSFLVGLWNRIALNLELYLKIFSFLGIDSYFTPVIYGAMAFFMLFSPLAGYLADIRYGRYKIVVRSLFLLFITVLIFLGVVLIELIGILVVTSDDVLYALRLASSIGSFIVIVTYFIGLVGFTANVIQFGIDQLHDSPGEDRTLFINWYVWLYFFTIFTGQLAWNQTYQVPYNIGENFNGIGICMLLAVLVVLPVTLCLARRRRRWFLIEPGSLNPYKLVYRVTKFARQHKTPVCRSAFTYCEDEVPTGLDLGKEKYGGPFTTEQVEDVKVFYGILKVLFSFGTVFFLDFAASSVLLFHAPHASNASEYYFNTSLTSTRAEYVLLNSGLLSPLLIVVCLPVYLCLLRPFISHCVPGILKRMGLGMLFVLLSLIASLIMATLKKNVDTTYSCKIDSILESSLLLIIPLTLSALSNMLIYTAVLEFICSQSPQSMKGLLIGLLYAIQGLYQLLAALLVLPTSFLEMSCRLYYYLVNVVLGVIAVLVYVCVAKRYRYRERDEHCNIRRYAEEYYSNPQQEEHYD